MMILFATSLPIFQPKYQISDCFLSYMLCGLLTNSMEILFTRIVLSAPVTGCYPKWRSFSVNRVPQCYLVVTNKRLKWEEAEEFCNDERSHLVSIRSKEEQNFIRSITGSNAMWIGFEKKRDWQWTDG